MKQVNFILTVVFCLLGGVTIAKDTNRIKLVYGSEGTLLPVSAQCTPESFSFSFGDEINFLTTYDDFFVNRFLNLSEILSPKDPNDSIQFIDPRIMAIVMYGDSTIKNDTICFEEYYGICKNGTLMEDNNALLNLVKKKIGWDVGISHQKAFVSEINLMKQCYSSFLIFLAIEHVANDSSVKVQSNAIYEYSIKNLLKESPEVVDESLYLYQKENNIEMLHRIKIWCEVYSMLIGHWNIDNNQMHILCEMPLIEEPVMAFLKDRKGEDNTLSDDERYQLLYIICNYLSELSCEERIHFFRLFFENCR